MTIKNDLCDFCGHPQDLMGNDMAQVWAGGTLWCGCTGGLIYKFRELTDQGLVDRLDDNTKKMEGSGLSYQNRGTDTGAWIDYLHLGDENHWINKEIQRRSDLMTEYKGMLKDGLTFWSNL